MKKYLFSLLAIFSIGMNANGQAGSLDLSFHNTGTLLTGLDNFTGPLDHTEDVIVLSDNKILLCGSAGTSTDLDMFVTKLTEFGDFDSTFATNGAFIISNPAGNDYAYDMEILPNGNIIVVGTKALSDADTEFAAWVITPDGTLDASFGVEGVYEMNLGAKEEIIHQVLIHNNLIYLVGRKNTPGAGYSSIAVQCIDLQGNLVPAFGTGGTAYFQPNSTDKYSVNGATMLPSGTLAICGDKYDPAATVTIPMIMLMTSNGSPDSSFGTNGVWLNSTNINYDASYFDIEYNNAKLIAAGTNGVTAMLRRHNLDGELDTTFGYSGYCINPFGFNSVYYDCKLGADNKWYATSKSESSWQTTDFITTRVTIDGFIDDTWGTLGGAETILGTWNDEPRCLGFQTDGKVVCAGHANQGYEIGVVRYLNDMVVVETAGCTVFEACNYNAAANLDDGSCHFTGDPCDDGLATTNNDAYNSNCTCEGVIGVEENNLFGLAIFPNPTANEITLTSDVFGNGSITILDITGRIAFQNKMAVTSSQKMNVQNLPNGVYSVVVTIQNKRSVVSFVKI
jgi:uncharacterized delta-60 repeat protein